MYEIKREKDVFFPMHKPPPTVEGLSFDNLCSEYEKMAITLNGTPTAIQYYQGLLKKVLEGYTESKGELVILDSNKSYFSYNGKQFTDFGIILLRVIKMHYVDAVQYHMELLILGQDIPSRIVRLESSELGSSRWIESLGPNYLYEKWGVEKLQTLIKAMSKYAPTRDEYQYSGWDVEDGKAYILDGHQLNSENLDADTTRNVCQHVFGMLDVASHSLTVPLLAVELLSLVHSRMIKGGIYFKGVCCIVAPTQSFKTTLAALFFNTKNGLQADLNFEATEAAIVRTIGGIRDSTTYHYSLPWLPPAYNRPK